jgi:hypothetical protein
MRDDDQMNGYKQIESVGKLEEKHGYKQIKSVGSKLEYEQREE